MKKIHAISALLLMSASPLYARGLDRSSNDYTVLGNANSAFEFKLDYVRPNVTGAVAGVAGGKKNAFTNTAAPHFSPSAVYKNQIDQNWAFAVYWNTPYGADIEYNEGVLRGTTEKWDTTQYAGVLQYTFDGSGVSVFGGTRILDTKAEFNVPTVSGYEAVTDNPYDFGFIVGTSFGIPGAGLRVSAAYESEVEQEFKVTETITGSAPVESTFATNMPQSVVVDAQFAVTPSTLLYGTFRWTDWSTWQVDTQRFSAEATNRNTIADVDDDVFVYRLGVGQKITDNLAVFASGTIELDNQDEKDTDILDHTSGRQSIELGGRFTANNVNLTLSAEYGIFSDVQDDTIEFTGNDYIGVSASVSSSF